MKSNDEMMSKSIGNIDTLMCRVSSQIDSLSSSELKRVLKSVSHVHIAEDIIHNKQTKLENKEQKLVDSIFHLLEDIMGYTQLKTEIDSKEKML